MNPLEDVVVYLLEKNVKTRLILNCLDLYFCKQTITILYAGRVFIKLYNLWTYFEKSFFLDLWMLDIILV
jgi:hypothetical protein